MHHDSQIIYGKGESNFNSFRLNGANYYSTKTGLHKIKIDNQKAKIITKDEYIKAWEKYNFIFN